MVSRSRIATKRPLALVWAVLALLQPFLGLQHALASAVFSRVPDCCIGPERPDCCPAVCEEGSGPVLLPELPECCKVQSPPSAPREPEPTARLAIPDPAKRVLLAIHQAAHSTDPVVAPWVGRDPSCDLLGPAPPGTTTRSRPTTLHWLTNRGTIAALALLSVARL